MKRLGLLVAAFLYGLISVLHAHVDLDSEIVLEGDTVISAGDPWELDVAVVNAEPGEVVDLVLLNGLQTLNASLILGSGGVAKWHVPEGQITQAGESLVIGSYADFEVRRPLTVLPLMPSTADLLTTANTLSSYGEGVASIMVMLRDRWGNPAPEGSEFSVSVIYPGGDQVVHRSVSTTGLDWYVLRSRGGPGRVRISLMPDTLGTSLELMQIPGEPAQVTLNVLPDCVLNDGRDVLQLEAVVHDSHDSPVIDGTLVKFMWTDGFGYDQTAMGRAALRIPAPTVPGVWTFSASVADAISAPVALRVTSGEVCADE